MGFDAEAAKADLHQYLRTGREVMLWKLDGLSEYAARRPLTPTGTNLLGLVKHLALVEAGYFGEVFGRPWPEPMPDLAEDAEPNADLWARADEPREEVIDRYRRVWAHADATIEALPLEAPGRVPWWGPERNPVTLHRILAHVATETHRHAGHADILREQLDGAAGHRPEVANLWQDESLGWAGHHARLERVAQQFR